MTPTEMKSLLSIAMLAAFADSAKDDRERDAVRQVAESLSSDLNMAAVYQDVLLGRVDVTSAAAGLATPALRHLAYEIAVGVCDADGLRNDAENRFLSSLGQALALGRSEMTTVEAEMDAVVDVPLAPVAPAAAPAVPGAVTTSDAELDQKILKAAVINGALELLPQSMASLAIIPLQMKLVYQVGKSYGFELDRGHIKDLLATLGVGLTGQYLEDIGRKLIGGLLGKAAGGMVGSIGRTATGAAFSFATTYALGQVAKRYYGGGRAMNKSMLQQAFTDLTGQGRDLQQQYLPQIQEQARTLDVAKIMSVVSAR